MPLLLPGYWPTTYFPRGYWEPDYWPHFNPAVSGGEGFGRWQPLLMERFKDDDDEVLVILG
jgi:hypothetical protein